MRVSSSGGLISVMRPDMNRLRRRLSSVLIEPGGAVRGEDELLAGVVERVEGVEKLLLELLFALDDLDVVNEQHVALAVTALESRHRNRPDRLDELVEKRFCRYVTDLVTGEVLRDVVADRLKEVGLAEPGPADDEQAGCRRCPGDSATDSAAAWAKRFDGPITKPSKV